MPAKRKPKILTPNLDMTTQFGRGVRIAPLSTSHIKKLIRASLARDFAIALRFAGRAEAMALNTQFKKRRYAPNVLTFSYLPDPTADIVICTPVVREQANDQGKAFSDHLSHMVVHGVLHAQGHDHRSPAEAKKMETLERDILARFGIQDPYQSR